jgi:hypothetical protein
MCTRAFSLLYFLGMPTLGASPRDALGYELTIPNRVIRELQWEHLNRELKAGVIVFVGAKKALFRPWDGAAPRLAAARGKKAPRAPRA